MMPTKNSNSASLRSRFDRAVKLHRARKSKEALEILECLAREYPKSAAVAGYLGGFYFQHDRFEQAAKWFSHATELSPKSETASLGLFHSLWNVGATSEAVTEMRRFLRL